MTIWTFSEVLSFQHGPPVFSSGMATQSDTMVLCRGDSIKPGTYRVLSRHRRAVNFIGPKGAMLFAVKPGAGAGPCTIVVNEAGGLPDTLNTEIFQHAPAYHARFPEPRGGAAAWARSCRTALQLLKNLAPPEGAARILLGHHPHSPQTPPLQAAFAQRLQEGLLLVKEGRTEEGAGLLRGLGPGLTPSGDDVLAGILFAWHSLERLDGQSRQSRMQRLHGAALGRNPLSNVFLDLAFQGKPFAHLAELAAALDHGHASSIQDALANLLSHGATSGADLASAYLVFLHHELAPRENTPL